MDNKQQEIKISKLPLHQLIKSSHNILVFGSRNSGKSSIVKRLVKLIRGDHICIMDPTIKSTYRDIIPSLYIYKEYNKELLERMKGVQEICRKRNILKPISLVLDECLKPDIKLTERGNPEFLMITKESYPELEELKSHFINTFVVSCQIIKVKINEDRYDRNDKIWQPDFIFLLFELDRQKQEAIYEFYCKKIFTTFDLFKDTWWACSKNKKCLVIDLIKLKCFHL
jgi:hypothetical protein